MALLLPEKGQSNVVSYAMLVAIGAVVALAFFYIYQSSAADIRTQTYTEKHTELERISSSLALNLPSVVKENSLYYGVIYNSGNLFSDSVAVSIIRSNGSTIPLTIKDENGTPITKLPTKGAGFFEIDPAPLDGEIVYAGSNNVFTFYVFRSDIMYARDVSPTESDLAVVDDSNVEVSIDECLPQNTFTWPVNVPAENIDSLYLDGYLETSEDISYFVVDSNGTYLYDTVSEKTHVTYDASDFDYVDGVLTACIKKVERDSLLIDYLHAIVIYTGNNTIGDTTAPVASNGSPTGIISDDTPLLGVVTDESAICKGSIDLDEAYADMDFEFAGSALTHSYQVTGALAIDNYTAYVRCEDLWGNTMVASYSWQFEVNTSIPDFIPPDIIIHSPENITYNASSVDLNFTTDDITDWCGYSLNGAGNVTLVGNTTMAAAAGPNTVTVYCNDTSGNMGFETQYFNVETFTTVDSTPYYSYEDDGNWWTDSVTEEPDGTYLTQDDYWTVLPDWTQMYFPDMSVPVDANIQSATLTFMHKETVVGDQSMEDDWRHMIYCYDGSDWQEIETYDLSIDVWTNTTTSDFKSLCVPDGDSANEIKIKITFDPASQVDSEQKIDWAKMDVYYT